MILTRWWWKRFRLPDVRTAAIITIVIISVRAITKEVTGIFTTAILDLPRFLLLVFGKASAASPWIFSKAALGEVLLCADRKCKFLFAIHANENLVLEFLKLIHV